MDFALTPDGRYLIAIGQPASSPGLASRQSTVSIPTSQIEEGFDLPLGSYSHNEDLRAKRTQMVVFDIVEGTSKMYAVSSSRRNPFFHKASRGFVLTDVTFLGRCPRCIC